MNSKIEIDGEWYECEFLYPFKEAPLEIPGPLGTRQWQTSKYNAKLVSVSNKVITLGRYNIIHNAKQLVFKASRPVINGILGSVF